MQWRNGGYRLQLNEMAVLAKPEINTQKTAKMQLAAALWRRTAESASKSQLQMKHAWRMQWPGNESLWLSLLQ